MRDKCCNGDYCLNQSCLLQWSKKPLSMDKLELAQYHLVNWNFSDYTKEDVRIGRQATNVSIIALEFNFQRRTGFFLLQVNYRTPLSSYLNQDLDPCYKTVFNCSPHPPYVRRNLVSP